MAESSVRDRTSMNVTKTFVASVSIGCAFFFCYSIRAPVAEQGKSVPTNLQLLSSVASGGNSIESQSRLVADTHGSIAVTRTPQSVELEKATAEAHEVVMCAQYKQDVWAASALLEPPVEGANPIQLKEREESLAAINARLSVSTPICENNAKSQENAYPKLLRAAQLGDMDAAVCYVEAPFPLDADQLAPIGLEDYRKNALALIDIGIQRGDWRFIELMRTAAQRAEMVHHAQRASSWFRRLIKPTPEDAYLYARLEQLGAHDAFSEQVSRMAESWRDGLPASAVDALNQRASNEYQQFFAQMPSLEEFPKSCGF